MGVQLHQRAGANSLLCNSPPSVLAHYSLLRQPHPTRLWYKHVSNHHTRATLRTQLHTCRKHGHSVSATMDSICTESESMQSSDPQPHQDLNLSNGATNGLFLKRLDAFNRFTRPHTIIGTVLGVICVSLLALESYQDISLRFVLEVIRVLVPTLLMNIYVVGINQVIDVEIDKVNKPNLPLASGEFSLNTGISLTIFCATLSFALGALVKSKILTWALIFGNLFGTGYSLELPLMRWKVWGPAAALSILFYRTFVIQICTFYHMQTVFFQRVAHLNKPMIFLSAFMCVLASVVAIFKDIPDLEGDRAHGIQSFVVQQGPERVFWFCVYLLTAAYGLAILFGLTSKVLWAQVGTIIGHAIATSVLWNNANKVDLKDKTSITRFYMFIWKLLYAEFFLAQFVR